MIRPDERQRRMRFVDHALLWREARRLRTFGFDELRAGAAVPERQVKAFLKLLMGNGIITSERPRHRGKLLPSVYTLARDLGRRAPRFRGGKLDPHPTTTERLWSAMRPLRGGFTSEELAGLARVNINTTKTYIAALARAGYLEAADPGARLYRYRIARGKNTGPEPPMPLRDGALYDPNLWDVVWRPSDAVAAAMEAA
ncbi:MAG TPA: hypothetical protein VD995_03225 [Azospirillum sp.]|nr:hypothetical protein [Azospirillum sp.]